MQYEIFLTEDGSHSIRIPQTGVSFHSTKGAIQESSHVFIESGMNYFLEKEGPVQKMQIFEVGFGTGLNALLSAQAAAANRTNVEYTAVDAHPLPISIFTRLNYPVLLAATELYRTITQTPWNQLVFISPFFKLNKKITSLEHFDWSGLFHVIYLDAFAPNDQPELWTPAVFSRMYQSLYPGGVLVTYCSKSTVRQDLQTAGFLVQKIPGPPGKREIIRAVKPKG